MKIVVLLKSVPDTSSILILSEDHKSLLLEDLKYIINPFDEYALEEAIRLKESVGGEVIAVSLGNENSEKILKAALAIGADEAICIKVKDTALEGLSSKGVSKVLAATVGPLSPDIVFAGKQAVDDDSSQVPERVAEILGYSHSSQITHFEFENNVARVHREFEGGYFSLELPLPAILTVQKGINSPRYPTLPDMLRARKCEIKGLTLEELGLGVDQLVPEQVIESLSLPRQERLLKRLDGNPKVQVDQLISILREEAMAL